MAATPHTPLRGKPRIVLQLAVYGYHATDNQPTVDRPFIQRLLDEAKLVDRRAAENLDKMLRNLRIQIEHVSSRAAGLQPCDTELIAVLCQQCSDAQLECAIARRQLRRLVGHNRRVFPGPVPPVRVCSPERLLFFSQQLCRLITAASKAGNLVNTVLPLDRMVELLTNACASGLPGIVDSVLDVLALQPLSAIVWADCVVQVISNVFNPGARSYLLQRRAILQALKQIAKVSV